MAKDIRGLDPDTQLGAFLESVGVRPNSISRQQEDRKERLRQLEAERDALLAQDEITEEDRQMVLYFIQEKGDITRWSDWESRRGVIFRAYPALKTALDYLAVSETMMDNVLNRIEEDSIE